jgi:ABC-type transport system involved in multi-copper enzyme maturation permease subunit
MTFMMENATMFAGMIVVMFAITSVTSFAYDSQSGWETYVLSIPVSRKDVVLSKYVLALLLAVAGGLLAMLVGWLNGIIKNTSNFSEVLVTAYVLFVVAVVFLSILLPLIYKFGVERSRVIILAVFAIPVAAGFVLGQTGTMPEISEQTMNQMLLLSPLAIAVCSIVSFMISFALYRKKEV